MVERRFGKPDQMPHKERKKITPKHIVAVDDETDVTDLIAMVFQASRNPPASFRAFPNGESLLQFIEENSVRLHAGKVKRPKIDLLFTDWNIKGGMDGVSLSGQVRAMYPLISIVLVTAGRALQDAPSLKDLNESGIDAVLSKPFNIDELERFVTTDPDGPVQRNAA